MKCFTTIIIASLLAMASAAPTARENVACNSAAASPAASTNGTAPATGSSSNSGNGTATAAGAGTNVQKFTGNLGGAPPPVIQTAGDRPFSVNGDTFVGIKAALGRSCDTQHNTCANAANSGKIDAEVADCDEQNEECHVANSLKRRHVVRDV